MNKMTNKDLLTVQQPITYIGNELNQIIKEPDSVDIRFAFCFPEIYEIGMSYLGMKILYGVLNNRKDTYCERVFAPNIDMEAIMREKNIKLYGLESKDSIDNFDFVGFTLQYELTYTNILNMLDLGGIPIFSRERTEEMPFICAGGPCAYNPEPLSPFIDFYMLGEGEEIIDEIMDIYSKWKKEKRTRKEFLNMISKIEGVYVPNQYIVEYKENGTIKKVYKEDETDIKVKKRIIKDLDKVYYPEKPILPYSSIVHNRIMLEIFRGCIRGCRFCQAGYIYRPVREKSVDRLLEIAEKSVESTGYEELSLTSLSTSDYTCFDQMALELINKFSNKKVSLSLPSLRIDSINSELLDKVKNIRKSGLTFAPEAGTQRLRNVINKNVTEEDIFKACDITFRKGWNNVKLYFMMGLPTETYEDLEGIVKLCNKIFDLFYSIPKTERAKSIKINVSVSTFVPKPFTAFQLVGQNEMDLIKEKIKYLKSKFNNKMISFNWNNPETSLLEAIIARGDRKIGNAIYDAWKLGAKFDGWNEHFKFDIWKKAFEMNNIDVSFYANRERDLNEILPWEFIDIGVTKKYLKDEYLKSLEEKTTPNCRQKCNGCGATVFQGGVCFEKN